MKQLKQFKKLGIEPKRLTINYLLTIRLYEYKDKTHGSTYHAGVAYINNELVAVRSMELSDSYNCYLNIVKSLGIERFESGQPGQGLSSKLYTIKPLIGRLKGLRTSSECS